MLESERWERLRQLTDGEPAPQCELALTWWQGRRHEADPTQSALKLLTSEPTPLWVAEFTVDGRQLFAEFDRLPDTPRGELRLVGWPELGGVVAVEGGTERTVSLPVGAKRLRGLTACN